MPTLSITLWVALGGALGSVARLWLAQLVFMLTGSGFPWGVLLINVLGSFVIGAFGALSLPGARISLDPGLRFFVMVGLCGGFTTFSSFSLQTLELLQHGAAVRAGANVVLSVGLCLVFVWLGWVLGGTAAVPKPGVG